MSPASATSIPGLVRKTKVGCAPRSTLSKSHTHISPIRNYAIRICVRSTMSFFSRMLVELRNPNWQVFRSQAKIQSLIRCPTSLRTSVSTIKVMTFAAVWVWKVSPNSQNSCAPAARSSPKVPQRLYGGVRSRERSVCGASTRSRRPRHHLSRTITDHRSPLVYGFDAKDLPVYFDQDPVFALSQTAAGFSNFGQDIVPNAVPVHTSPYEGNPETPPNTTNGNDESPRQRPWSQGPEAEDAHPRVVMQIPAKADDLLLSGMLSGGQALTNRVLLADIPLGRGHIVVFCSAPLLALANTRDILSALQRDS